jgi:hypothetical protein
VNGIQKEVRRIASVVLAGCLLLTGCGRGGAEADETPSLDEQLGLSDEGMLQRQSQAENHIRDCMKQQGFDYVPVDPRAQMAAMVGAAGLSKEDFEKQFGYGITTLYEQRLNRVGDSANVSIREGLSDADRAAYDRALHGDNPTATLGAALDSGDFTQLGGCIKEAADAVFGGPEVLSSLQAKLDELDERMLADPRMVKAVRAWTDCMRAAGYPGLQEPESVDATLQAGLDAIVGTGGPYDRAALTALQKDEVAMVGADIACEEQHISDVEDEVTTEYEARFRQENATLLSRVP